MKIDGEHLLYARLKNQFLTDSAPCSAVVSALCGLQAQFANNPKYALRIRGSDFDESNWSAGLVKTWSFRHTLHAVRADELGLFLSACGVPANWDNDWGVDGGRMERFADFLLGQIRSGVEDRAELREKCRAAGIGQDDLGKIFHGWGGAFYEMNRRGMIAYRPGTEKKFLTCPGVKFMDRDTARASVLRRYFRAFGPAMMEDCAAFTGFKKREIQSLVKNCGITLQTVSSGDTEYFYTGELPDAGAIPPCLFLAGFDQMIMGYKNRALILDGKFKKHVVTVSGIVNPTVLYGGRVLAKWKKDGARLIVTQFSKTTKKMRSVIAAYGEKLFGKDEAKGGVREIIFE